MDHRKLFGRRVRRLRKAAGLSLEDAAERAGLSSNYWGEVERSRKVPSLDTVVAMAKALDVPLPVIVKLDREEDARNLRASINALLDRSTREQMELIHRLAKSVLEP